MQVHMFNACARCSTTYKTFQVRCWYHSTKRYVLSAYFSGMGTAAVRNSQYFMKRFVLSAFVSVWDGGGSSRPIVRICWTGSGWKCWLMMAGGVWIFYIQLSWWALQHTRFVEEYYCNTRSSFFVSKRTKVIFGHLSWSKLLSVLKTKGCKTLKLWSWVVKELMIDRCEL
jgi:hypothetical protein